MGYFSDIFNFEGISNLTITYMRDVHAYTSICGLCYTIPMIVSRSSLSVTSWFYSRPTVNLARAAGLAVRLSCVQLCYGQRSRPMPTAVGRGSMVG